MSREKFFVNRIGFVLIMCLVLSVSSEREAKRLHSTIRASTGNADSNSLLDTFSLSWSGDFDFSRTLEGVSKILEGIASCKCFVRD